MSLTGLSDFKPQKEIRANVDIYSYPTPDKIRLYSNDDVVTLGDLHGNAAKFLYFLVREGMIEISKENYDQFIEIYKNSKNNYDLKAYQEILKNITLTKPCPALRLIGDDIADRGNSDTLTLLLYERLNQLNFKKTVIASNHGVEFLKQYALGLTNPLTGHRLEILYQDTPQNKYQFFGRSYYGLRADIQNNKMRLDTVEKIIQKEYLPNLKMLTYHVNNDNQIILYSHAPITNLKISLLASVFDVKYQGKTVHELAQTIDQINDQWQQILKDKNSLKSFFARTDPNFMHFDNFVNDRYDDLKKYDYLKLKDEITPPYNVVNVHGHVGDGQLTKSPVPKWEYENLDTDTGKGDGYNEHNYFAYVKKEVAPKLQLQDGIKPVVQQQTPSPVIKPIQQNNNLAANLIPNKVQRFITLEDSINANTRLSDGGNLKDGKHLFIFPGNKGHHGDKGHTLLSKKKGSNLAKVAEDLADKPVLSLTTGRAGEIIKMKSEGFPEASIADLWKAIGAGYILVLPARKFGSQGDFFKTPLEGTNNLEPSFWGGKNKVFEQDVADFYMNSLNQIIKFLNEPKPDLNHVPPQYQLAYQAGIVAAQNNQKDWPLHNPNHFKPVLNKKIDKGVNNFSPSSPNHPTHSKPLPTPPSAPHQPTHQKPTSIDAQSFNDKSNHILPRYTPLSDVDKKIKDLMTFTLNLNTLYTNKKGKYPKSHSGDISNLCTAMDEIKRKRNISYENMYVQMVNLIEQYYLNERSKFYNQPILSLIRDENKNQFESKVSQADQKNSFVYPKLLADKLQSIYEVDGKYLQAAQQSHTKSSSQHGICENSIEAYKQCLQQAKKLDDNNKKTLT